MTTKGKGHLQYLIGEELALPTLKGGTTRKGTLSYGLVGFPGTNLTGCSMVHACTGQPTQQQLQENKSIKRGLSWLEGRQGWQPVMGKECPCRMLTISDE